MRSSLFRPRMAAVLLAAWALVPGCGNSGSPPPQPTNVTPVDPATAGTITVHVAFKGQPPAPKEISLRGVAACAALHTAPVYDEAVRATNAHLADVVVYVKEGLGDRAFAFPSAAVIIDQRGCLYEPKVVALMVGQPLTFRNSDPEAHNVHGQPKVAKGWNFLMSRQSSERTVYFDRPEVGIPIRCDVHPWMLSHVSVFTHPYFAVTGSTGAATLTPLPPGTYTIAAWHRELGTKEQTVTLASRGAAQVEIEYP